MVIIYTVAGAVGFLRLPIAGVFLRSCRSCRARRSRWARRRPSSASSAHSCTTAAVRARAVHSQALYYAVTLFVFGLIMRGVDNYAHAGGFLGGYVASRVLDPLKPERIDHLVLRARVPRGVDSLDHRVGHSRVGPAVNMRRPVVLITGASGEIGHGLIERLAAISRGIVTLDITPLEAGLGRKCCARSAARSSTTRCSSASSRSSKSTSSFISPRCSRRARSFRPSRRTR